MAGKSFLSKFKDAILDRDEEEETAEDIDRKLEADVAAIKKHKGMEVDGASILMDDWEGVSDQVYIMALLPIYKAIGSRTSPLARRLADVCDNMFGRHVSPAEGTNRVQGDLFMMSFNDTNKTNCFHKAAEIVNEIGVQMMGDGFKTIELPGLLVVTDKADLIGEGGAIDMSKAKAQVKKGGSGGHIGEPGPDEPVWLKLSRENANRMADLVMSARPASAADDGLPHRRSSADADWVRDRTDRRVRINLDDSIMDRRSGKKRRIN